MDARCNTCKKGPPEVSLKRCAKCSTTPYCSRDCQKADWKANKKICGSNQSTNTASSSSRASNSGNTRLSPPKGLDQPVSMPFTRLDKGTWLHNRTEMDVYRLLIDAYRLRVEDTYTMEGELMEGSIYDGNPDGLPGFRKFLRAAAAVPGLLPPWWSNEKKAACERLGMDASQWSDLRCAVEKSDIIEQYGDPQFPMQLRMLAEAVYKRGPGGSDGTAMRKMMMSMEGGAFGGDAYGSILDTTTMGLSDIHNGASG
ncbi:hypothetical protein GGI35DRAFT_408243 [Trichoderma velutinum]